MIVLRALGLAVMGALRRLGAALKDVGNALRWRFYHWTQRSNSRLAGFLRRLRSGGGPVRYARPVPRRPVTPRCPSCGLFTGADGCPTCPSTTQSEKPTAEAGIAR